MAAGKKLCDFQTRVYKKQTLEFGCAPAVGDVEALASGEQSEVDGAVRVVRVGDAHCGRDGPVGRAERAHQQSQRQAAAQEGHEDHAPLVHVHLFWLLLSLSDTPRSRHRTHSALANQSTETPRPHTPNRAREKNAAAETVRHRLRPTSEGSAAGGWMDGSHTPAQVARGSQVRTAHRQVPDVVKVWFRKKRIGILFT